MPISFSDRSISVKSMNSLVWSALNRADKSSDFDFGDRRPRALLMLRLRSLRICLISFNFIVILLFRSNGMKGRVLKSSERRRGNCAPLFPLSSAGSSFSALSLPLCAYFSQRHPLTHELSLHLTDTIWDASKNQVSLVSSQSTFFSKLKIISMNVFRKCLSVNASKLGAFLKANALKLS